MDEVLDILKTWRGDVTISFNHEKNVFEFTASCGRFYRTIEMQNSDKIEKGAAATVILLRSIRLVKEKMQEASDARRNQSSGMAGA